jgi:hypothetical protein
MSRYFLLFIISSFIISSEISNIQVSQRQDGSGIVDICYDLIEDEGIYGSFEVNLEISLDGGETFSSVNASSLFGDAGDNVIPGNGLCMQYQAQSELFIAQAKVKIIASSSFVSSQLPFSMVNIVSNSNNQSNNYEGETIDYDYEMMQFELTNVDLVTFLETYSFELTDGEPLYDCSNFTEYFNGNPWDGSGTIYGCMDPDALNYNPSATHEGGEMEMECIYEDDGGCTDSSAINYDYMNPDNFPFDDCSCLYEPTISDTGVDGDCNWNDWTEIWLPGEGGGGDGGGGEGFDADEFWEDWAINFESGNGNSSNVYSFSGCIDPSAINYSSILPNFLNDIQYSGVSIDNLEECMIIDNSSCVYECEYDLGNSLEENNVNINTFETQDISRQGNSFLIEEGKANHPIILNSQSCVDGVVAKLFMDYYGLRIPTAGEWKKAAREDNTRCWPWMEGTCESAGSAYCSDFFATEYIFNGSPVTTEEELNTCITAAGGPACNDLCNNQYEDCAGGCSTGLYDCLDISTDPDCSEGSEGGPSNWDECDCMDPFNQCETTCTYNESLCQAQCTNADWSSEDCDFLYQEYQECTAYTTEINSDCNQVGSIEQEWAENYGLPWLQSEEALEFYENLTLSNLLGGQYEDFHVYEYFNHLLFYNRFSLADCGGDYECQTDSENGTVSSLNITSVGQHPMGQSSLGLYDMIGNAPEAVMYNGDPDSPPVLYTLNYRPEESMLLSFCASDDLEWSTQSHPSSLLMVTQDDAGYFQYYGLRLARTLAQ